ncbi:hypothetical protein CSH63_17740 [Micromonospora tulbaghiae]|uniref:Uncharacterized protein n=1 Tax=Micromonospora tulbaghiae TaxID=479978 RepID=A0A386WRV1_9ACTN|nr:hypothetical protein CSH63_17740 [Micromonospora tulbaghiae]
MRVMAAPQASFDQVAVAADRPVHVVCCDPHEALCGANVAARPYTPDEVEPTCALCALAYANDLPCANPRCPE